MIRVGLYTGYLSADNPGSIGYYLINLARQLMKCKDIELYLIYEKAGDHPLYGETTNILLSRFPILNPSELRRQKLDIIHFNGIPQHPRQLPSVFLAKDLKKVATAHGDIIFANPSLYGYSRLHIIMYQRFMLPISSKSLDALIPVSRNLGDRLARYLKISDRKIRPVHHGIDRDIFKPIPDAKIKVIRKYGLRGNFILHLSKYGLRKNPSGLLGTFEKLVEDGVDIDLVIVGKRWKENIHQLLSKMNLKAVRRIKVLGSVPLEDLPLLYSAAQLFFFPSYHENFGFPNIEAMACGTPVVTSKAYSIPEVTGDAAILCEPSNVPEFVSAIRHVLEDNNLKNEMKNKGLENARRFNWEKCAQETIEVYKEVLSNRWKSKK